MHKGLPQTPGCHAHHEKPQRQTRGLVAQTQVQGGIAHKPEVLPPLHKTTEQACSAHTAHQGLTQQMAVTLLRRGLICLVIVMDAKRRTLEALLLQRHDPQTQSQHTKHGIRARHQGVSNNTALTSKGDKMVPVE